ncbi:MAG: porin [Myxococcaceae bacterium]|nr:porin [Myxococcaceae bacterium]
MALLTLTSGAALAQTTEPQPATGTAPPAETAPAPAEAPEAPAAPSVDDRLTTAEGKITSIEEQYAETKTDVSGLKKLKISGYVQGRYQAQQALDDTGTGGFSRFAVRRARIKTTYAGDYGQLVVQVDAVPTGVSLKDAEATLFIPGTKKNLSLTVGQMKWPFGYEVLQSSSDREFPERSRVVGALFSGERDRGVRFNGKFSMLRVSAGLFDGNGTNNRNFIGVDNDKEKDVVGRVGFDMKWISGGVSGWHGTTLGMRTTGPNPDAFRTAYDRTRLGADLQLYLDLLPLGGTALKGEYITGTTYQRSGVEQLGVPASGWWLLLVQTLGLSNAVALRYDYFDPENGRAPTESNGRLGSNNPIGTFGIAAIHYFGKDVKLTAAYELPMTATAESGTAEDPSDNLFTLQLQVRY